MKNRNTRKMPPKEAGFTLVEVLVAMAVFSAALVTLFSSFDAFLVSGRMIRDRRSQGAVAGQGLRLMVSDLEQIFVLQPPRFQKPGMLGDEDKLQARFGFSGGESNAGGRQFSTMGFASLSPIQFNRPFPDKRTGVTRISYYVHDHGERLDLHRSDRPALLDQDTMENDPCTDPVVFRDIKTFDLIFIDDQGGEHPSWDSEDEDFGYGLPARIGIHIQVGGGKGEIETAVFLPVTRQVPK